MKPLCPEQATHSNNFDFTRFILAILVVFTHSFVVYYGPELHLQKEPLWLFTGGQLSVGTLAVNFFFAISGFLILQSLQSSKSYFDF